ncbi:LamG-like jellyroll fold domain-containing protein [Dactylosporangium sp. NPDC000244]|uniref:LamG-like jellyroll fold domain-containing protein n=1 Tax=Dactylosporangium sp. NPDC000244 TaxID=3154365 RepID=UPI0033321128
MKTWGNLAGVAAGVAALPVMGSGAIASPAAAEPVVIARYDFDAAQKGATVADVSGHGHTLAPSAVHGGKVRLPARGSGRAAAFPAKCTGKKCPHAVLQAPDAPELNPGANPIRFGATVRLAKGQTGSGENILQKGYSASGGQYKLQVDGKAGRPSCVVSDNVVRGIHVARSDVSIADGKWHTLECRRAGAALTLLVDGAVHATLAIPATLAITNTVPLSVGGKGNGTDNDQFHGTLDDVWIALG